MFRGYVLMALLACLSSAGLEAKRFRGVDLPEILGDMAYQSSHDYEKDNPGLGSSFAYKSTDGATATVYVYDMGRSKIGDGIRDQLVQHAAISSAKEVRAIADRDGYGVGLEVSDFRAILVGRMRVWRSDVKFEHPELGHRNLLILVCGLQNNVLKVRMTAGGSRGKFEKRVEALLHALGNSALKAKRSKKKKEVALDAKRMESENSALYLLYRMGRETADKPFSFEAEMEVCEAIAEAAKKPEMGLGMDEYLKAYEAGFLKEYVWVFLRNYAWDRPEGLRVEEFESWGKELLKGHRIPEVFQ